MQITGRPALAGLRTTTATRPGFKPNPLNPPAGLLEHPCQILRMVRHLYLAANLAANLACFVQCKWRSLSLTHPIPHDASLRFSLLMLVAAHPDHVYHGSKRSAACSKPPISHAALMPIDGFFEWKDIFGTGKNKQPYAIAMKSGEPFALGGALGGATPLAATTSAPSRC